MTYLLDVNVLIALLDRDHAHNLPARVWFDNLGDVPISGALVRRSRKRQAVEAHSRSRACEVNQTFALQCAPARCEVERPPSLVRLWHQWAPGSLSASNTTMADTLTVEQRSKRMSLVRGANTKPELLVRRIAHSLGFRYRLQVKELPGKPDLVFPRLHKVIFVHGCFWHRHRKAGCKLARLPKSKLEFWEAKLEANRKRDQRNKRLLRTAGWSVLEVWECEMQNMHTLTKRLRYFLENEIA